MRKSLVSFFIVVAVLVLQSPRIVEAQTYVRHVISSSTTWTQAQSPIVLIGNTLVPQGVTLTIEPGVEVKFDGFYSLDIEGELIARGLPWQHIVFTSNRQNLQPGDWRAIWFRHGSVDAVVDSQDRYVSGSIISYADISFGGPIWADASSPYISNNTIRNVHGGAPRDWPHGAIWLCNSNSIVKDNRIEDNLIGGIVVFGSGGKILSNVIRRNSAGGGGWGGGMLILGGGNCPYDNSWSSSPTLVERNNISENQAGFGAGLALYSGSPVIRNNLISRNIVSTPISIGGNAQGSGAAIGVFSGGSAVIECNNITGNVSHVTGSHQSTAIFYSWSSGGTINQNHISNPTDFEIYLNTQVTIDSDASTNYWGTTNLVTIQDRIWDFDDDYNLGHVQILPILNQLPFCLTPIRQPDPWEKLRRRGWRSRFLEELIP